jgi:protein TonB
MFVPSVMLATVLIQPSQPAARSIQPDRPTFDCRGPEAAAGPSLYFCRAEEALASYDRTPKDARRQVSLRSAAENYRGAADLSRDDRRKSAALERLAEVHGEKYLDEPAAEEAVLRELVRLTPDVLALHFRIARLQEKMDMPEGAESTLLNVRYLYPGKQEVYRELAAFYARRTTALFAERARERRREAVPGQPDEEGVYTVGGELPPPTKLQHVSPQFPADALNARFQGVVIAEIVVDEAGRVRDATIVRSIPLLDDAALAAVRRWQFKPTTVEGRVVPVRMTVTVNFTHPR